MQNIKISRKLKPLLTTPKRYKVAIGGRGSGKSTTIADILLIKSMAEKARVGCFREYQNSIEDSVHSLLKDEVTRLEMEGFTIKAKSIEHNQGGFFKFKGLARSIDTVKSMQGFKYFHIEEAQFLSDSSLKILTPTLREEESELYFSANPMSQADPFSQKFIVPFETELKRDGYYEDDLHLVIFANYYDNPWFPDVLDADRKADYMNLDRAMYDHIWEGAYNDSVENSIIKAEWFDACIDAHKKLGFEPQSQMVLAYDPSDEGEDTKAIAIRHGSVITDIQEMKTGDVEEGTAWALTQALDNRVDLFVWDADGMGAGLKYQISKATEGKKMMTQGFRGGNFADRPDDIYIETGERRDSTKDFTNRMTFKNKRAQYYTLLKDKIYNTYLAVEKGIYKDPDELISFDSNIDILRQVRSEICRIPRKFHNLGMIQIMSKPDMKRLLKIKSPNLADAVMMAGVSNQMFVKVRKPTLRRVKVDYAA